MAPERGEGRCEEGLPAPGPPGAAPKEGDKAVEERGEDDDLTSLTWLQDRNLLKGINLRSSSMGKQESPTSDYVEECVSERSECSSVASSSPLPHPKHPHHIPYDPKVHVTSKPPYSFSCLIFMSIEDSEGKALPVKEIYSWILDHFPYYRSAPTGWKNSVRHNLSLNKCFRKVDKAPNLGKGSLWMVDPVFRPNLVQALMKAPYHPYTNIDYTGINKSSRTSAATMTPKEEESSGPDEIDDAESAAAAMLTLKHGPHACIQYSHREEYYKRPQNSTVNGVRHKEDGRAADHTYSVEPGLKEEPTLSDEAFQEGSDSNSSWNIFGYDPEERRKTEEGADALLDLAGVPRGPPPPPDSPPPKRPRPKRRKPIAPQRTKR